MVLPEEFLGEKLLSADDTMQRKLNWPRVRKEASVVELPKKDALLRR